MEPGCAGAPLLRPLKTGHRPTAHAGAPRGTDEDRRGGEGKEE
jgi:hypothetical protein